jgi:hypothetical protein
MRRVRENQKKRKRGGDKRNEPVREREPMQRKSQAE